MFVLEDIHLSISGTPILNGIDLTIEEGETVGLIGPNGSGKTTLFNCMSGFSSPSQGKILYKEKDITRLRPYQRAKLGIGRVFQNFGIFREMTLHENVVTAMEGSRRLWSTINPWGQVARKIQQDAHTYLEEIGLAEKASQKAGSLSGGQMRLLEIIRTLAFGADLFLLDEPTAGVSPKMKGQVADLIVKLQGHGKTVVIIEHDINFIRKFCNRVVVLDQGKVILSGAPDEVSKSEHLQEIYFGSNA